MVCARGVGVRRFAGVCTELERSAEENAGVIRHLRSYASTYVGPSNMISSNVKHAGVGMNMAALQ